MPLRIDESGNSKNGPVSSDIMTAKKLIEILQAMNPDLPIQIRIDRNEPQKNNESLKTDELRTLSPSSLRYSLQPTDVIDTWDGNTGAVAIELSARIS